MISQKVAGTMVSIVGASGRTPLDRASAARPYHARRANPMVGATRRPPLPSATIHPVRYFSKGFSPSNIRGVIPGFQGPGSYRTGRGCSAILLRAGQMDFLRDHQH